MDNIYKDDKVTDRLDKEIQEIDKNIGKINVAQLEFRPMGRVRKLAMSSGRVLVEGEPIQDSADPTRLIFPDDGLYSEKIFGPSRDSVKSGSHSVLGTYPDRMKKYGHIELPVPYIAPHFYGTNGSRLHLILGITKPSDLVSIIDWEKHLLRVENPSVANTVLETMRQSKSVSAKMKPVPLDIQSKYADLDLIDSNMTGKTYSYWLLPVGAIESIRTITKEGEKDVYSKMRTNEDWTSGIKGSKLFGGPYAIIHLLSRVDYLKEIEYTRKKLIALRERSLSGVEPSGAKMAISKKDKISKMVDNYSKRVQTLINFQKNNVSKDAIVSDILLVSPAGVRDISLRDDGNGQMTIIPSDINVHYKKILETANKNLEAKVTNKLTIDEMLNSNGSTAWASTVSIDQDIITAIKIIQGEINTISKEIIPEKIGKKNSKFRQEALSKRFDDTGRSVITPEPKLKIDEMGIPMYILKEFLQSRLAEEKRKSNIAGGTKGKDAQAIMKFLSNVPPKKFSGYADVKSERNTIDFEEIGSEGEFGIIEMDTDVVARKKLMEKIDKILEDVRVVIIRFPSLHKYNQQGFKIVPVYGHTMKLHPLMCTAYNADFDGDQVSNYFIETPDAVKEVDMYMLPSKNMLGANGDPLMAPTQDAVLGSYFMTLGATDRSKIDDSKVRTFKSYDDMIIEYERGMIGVQDVVDVLTPSYDKSIYKRNYIEHIELEDIVKPNSARMGTELPYIELGRIAKNNSITRVSDIEVFEDSHKDATEFKMVRSTVGRFIFNSCFPQDLGFVDRTKDKFGLEIDPLLKELEEEELAKGSPMMGLTGKSIKTLISATIEDKLVEEAVYVMDMVKEVGYENATLSGMSMSMQDLYAHPDKENLIKEGLEESKKIEQEESDGKISTEERYNKKISLWTRITDEIGDKTMDNLPYDNPVRAMSVSGSRGNRTQITQLMGIRGLMADTSGKIIETPITSSFEDGLSGTELFIASYGTRKGIYDRSNRTKDTGAATRTSAYGAVGLLIRDGDCDDAQGIKLFPLKIDIYDDKGEKIKKPGGGFLQKTIKPVMERIKGKFLLEDLLDKDGNVVVESGLPVMKVYKELEEIYAEKGIQVRSPLTCKHRDGICGKCYGYYYGSNRFPKIGDAVGVIAAQSVGEPGTQLTMRTFHTGGVAKGDITQGFQLVRNLLETSQYPKELQDSIDALTNTTEDTLRLISENVIKNLRDNPRNSKYTIGTDFVSYGVINGQKYTMTLQLIKDLLQIAYKTQGVDLLDVHYEVLARAMGSEYRVVGEGDSKYSIGEKVSWGMIKSTNEEFMKSPNLEPMIVTPIIQSLKSVAQSELTPFLSMTYQNMNKAITNALTINGIDNLDTPMTSIIFSNALASGDALKSYNKLVDKRYEHIQTRTELNEQLGLDVERGEEVRPETVIDRPDNKPIDLDWKPKTTETNTKEEVNIIEETEDDLLNLDWTNGLDYSIKTDKVGEKDLEKDLLDLDWVNGLDYSIKTDKDEEKIVEQNKEDQDEEPKRKETEFSFEDINWK